MTKLLPTFCFDEFLQKRRYSQDILKLGESFLKKISNSMAANCQFQLLHNLSLDRVHYSWTKEHHHSLLVCSNCSIFRYSQKPLSGLRFSRENLRLKCASSWRANRSTFLLLHGLKLLRVLYFVNVFDKNRFWVWYSDTCPPSLELDCSSS